MKIKVQVNDKGELLSQCGVSLDAPKAVVSTSLNKVGKTKSSSKIKFDTAVIALGRAELPEDISLTIIPNKELFKHYHIILAENFLHFEGNCSIDIPVIALDNTTINAGTPIAKISLAYTKKASLWKRLCLILGKVQFIKILQDEQQASRN